MKQVLIKKGKAFIGDVPSPVLGDGEVLIEVKYSLISTGTEMTNVVESGKSLVQKAKEQPENVKLVLDMVKKQGLMKTLNLVRNALEVGTPTGYSVAGIVIATGKNVKNIVVGDSVAAAGAGKANHAEIVAVPKNLVVKIPKGVTFAEASSVTLGSIAMQGVRQANVCLGDYVVVQGLGLIGLLTVQMLQASGCHVIGIDIDKKRLELAKELGCEYILNAKEITQVNQITDGFGADKVIITAAAKSDDLINQAMQMVRKKGTVVIVGAVGLGLKRSPFYEKEVDLKIACSYGPGRYDSEYEEKGIDYPYAYVRWTENRNLSEYLKLIAEGKVNFKKIAEREYVIDEAEKAYSDLKLSENKPLAVLLKYPERVEKFGNMVTLKDVSLKKIDKKIINVAVIGLGGFATGMHLLNLEKLGDQYRIMAVVDRNGVVAKQIAEKYDVKYVSTDYEEILKKKDIDMVLVCTRHVNHFEISKKALLAGKAVLCEKPMVMNREELDELAKIIEKTKLVYSVGFNRRYSPVAKKIKEVVGKRVNPLMIYYRMNAGYIPLNHWVHGSEGGGRIIGEGCHIVDLFTYLTGSRPIEISSTRVSPKTGYYSSEDNASITIKYEDGSVCTLIYTAMGNGGLSKEYMEVNFDNKTIVMDDYKSLKGFGVSCEMEMSQDKGHLQELVEFGEGVVEGKMPIDLGDLLQTTDLTFRV